MFFQINAPSLRSPPIAVGKPCFFYHGGSPVVTPEKGFKTKGGSDDLDYLFGFAKNGETTVPISLFMRGKNLHMIHYNLILTLPFSRLTENLDEPGR